MEFSKSYAGYYTTLDSIFDTRLSLLSIMFPKFTDKLLEQNLYRDRIRDVYTCEEITVSHDVLQPFYKTRNKNLLRYSGLTLIPHVIGMEINRHQYNNFNGECFRPWHLHINTYPYNLTPEEQENVVTIFSQYIEEKPTIIFHHLNPKSISSDFLYEHEIEVVVDYHGLEWLQDFFSHSFKIQDTRLELCVPKILNTNDYGYKHITEETFDLIEKTYAPFIDLNFVDTYIFSDRFTYELGKNKNQDDSTQ